MYTKDDHDTAKVTDRFIAGVVAGLGGYFFGGFVEFFAMKLLNNGYGLAWVVSIGFAAFGFLAPSRSRELWSEFWSGLLSVFSSRR